MHWEIVAQPPLRPRRHLNLTPRLHTDETLSSWLERLAGAYQMTLREFCCWLGYRNFFYYASKQYDLDVSAPEDLWHVLSAHTGLEPATIAAHRMDQWEELLPPQHRRTFCPECWVERGAYRCSEWAHGWSLVCRRHRRLLSERPKARTGHVDWFDEPWSEFYRSVGEWRVSCPPWKATHWKRICKLLGVEPRSEFMRAWPWFVELYGSAIPSAQLTTLRRGSKEVFPRCYVPPDTRCDIRTVKQDLALYAMVGLWHFRLLQDIDETIANEDFIYDTDGGSLCDLRTPTSPYWVRVFAVALARHLWVRMIRGKWECRRYEAIEFALDRSYRWNDEEWWLEMRLRTWPRTLEDAGRQLFKRNERFVSLPPWERCRQCVRHAKSAIRGLRICLPDSWHCQFREPGVVAERDRLIADFRAFEAREFSKRLRRSSAKKRDY